MAPMNVIRQKTCQGSSDRLAIGSGGIVYVRCCNSLPTWPCTLSRQVREDWANLTQIWPKYSIFFVWSVTENEYNKCLLEKYTATIIFRSYLAIDCLYEHNFCIDVALDDVAKEDNLLLTINNRAEKYIKILFV